MVCQTLKFWHSLATNLEVRSLAQMSKSSNLLAPGSRLSTQFLIRYLPFAEFFFVLFWFKCCKGVSVLVKNMWAAGGNLWTFCWGDRLMWMAQRRRHFTSTWSHRKVEACWATASSGTSPSSLLTRTGRSSTDMLPPPLLPILRYFFLLTHEMPP